MSNANLKTRIVTAENRGAPIFSFTYNGKERNVQINTKKAGDIKCLPWGTPVSKSVVENDGDDFVIGVDQNDDYQLKAFNLALMEDVKGV